MYSMQGLLFSHISERYANKNDTLIANKVEAKLFF